MVGVQGIVKRKGVVMTKGKTLEVVKPRVMVASRALEKTKMVALT